MESFLVSVGLVCVRFTLTHRLQVLLDFRVQSTSLQSDDLRGRIGVVGDGRAALGAEDAVDGMARRALAGPGLGGTVDGQSGLRDDGDESYPMLAIELCVCLVQDGERTVGRAALTLAVITVVVSGDSRLINRCGVSDSAAKAVTGERHVDGDSPNTKGRGPWG